MHCLWNLVLYTFITCTIARLSSGAPEFVVDPTKLNLSINTNWDKGIPLNERVPIQIFDKDHDFSNAQIVHIYSSRDDILRFETTTRLHQIGDPIPLQYLSDVNIFIREDFELVHDSMDIQIIVTDGIHTPSSVIIITLDIQSNTLPQFTQIVYYHKLSVWPRENSYFEPNPPIQATISDDPNAILEYRINSVDTQFTDPEFPGLVLFTRQISPMEGKQVMIVEVTATKMGSSLSSTVPLVIEFPPMPKPIFRLPEFKSNVPWNDDDKNSQEIIIMDVVSNLETLLAEFPSFKIESIYPYELNSSHIVLDDRSNNNIYLTLNGITQDVEIQNNVVFVRIIAQLGEAQFERTAHVTVALYFPENHLVQ